jgi:hypothetical protein
VKQAIVGHVDPLSQKYLSQVGDLPVVDSPGPRKLGWAMLIPECDATHIARDFG